MNYEKLMNGTLVDMKPSGIRKFFDIAAEMEDVISLSVGEPDFATPWHIRQEGIKTLEKGRTWYSPNAGFLALREAISGYVSRHSHVTYDPKTEVLVTVGGSKAIDLCFRSLITPGDEVLIPEPAFVCYDPLTRMAGGVPVPLVTKAEDAFRLRADVVAAAITPKTKLLVLPYPNNPTGAIMPREDLEALAEVLRGTDVMVLSDEIYDQLVFDGKPVSTAKWWQKHPEKIAVLNGLSKAFAMPGWRVGFTLAHEDLIKQCSKLQGHMTSHICSIAQKAGVAALEGSYDCVDEMRQSFIRRRDMAMAEISTWPGVVCAKPAGAFYLFPDVSALYTPEIPDSTAMCTYLLEKAHVACVPGEAFGDPNCIRLSYAVADEILMDALRRMKEALYN